tara:strand:+ start:609 stop:773 length:165 start_codon:yes stop_codon:yes gene_type:complete
MADCPESNGNSYRSCWIIQFNATNVTDAAATEDDSNGYSRRTSSSRMAGSTPAY